MSQRRKWDRDAQPGPAWAQSLVVRRPYLVEVQAARPEPGSEPAGEVVLETSDRCAVGDVIAVPGSVLARNDGGETWKIVAREATGAPYVARLIVTPA